MKLWLANRIISFFYAVLRWAYEVRMEAESEEKVFLFVPIQDGKPVDRQSMN